jgi:penicillin amidase
MRRPPRTVAWLLAVGLGAAAAGQAAPPDSTLALPGLSAPVRVLTDRYGIPHLMASSRHDLYFAWGFVTARDRLAQLDYLRRAARGELSQVLGNRGLRADGGARLFELAAHAARMWGEVPPGSPAARAIEGFCAGVNAYLDAHGDATRRWPRELRLVHARPARWSPEDVVAVTLAQGLLLDLDAPQLDRALAADRNRALPPDSLARLREGLTYDTIPPEAAAALYGAGGPTGWSGPPARPSAAPARRPPDPSGGVMAARPAAADALAARARRALEDFAAGFASAGLARGASNVFAVGGARSARGSGLLANDPHLRLSAPGYWYVVHLTIPDTLDAAGACVPGTPVLITGRNRDLAWGITALAGQALEIYADTLDGSGRWVRWRGAWTPIRRASYGLRYRKLGLRLPVPGQVRRYTPHGPVLAMSRGRGLAYAIRWAALEDARGMGVIGLEAARSFDELRSHLAGLPTPTLSLAAADRSGGVYYQVVGNLPRRTYPMPWGPTPGGGDHEWSGLLDLDELPGWRATARGYVVNGNNRPVGAPYPRFIGYYDWNDDRARRMDQRLAGDSSITALDMASVQNDVFSLEAERLVPHLLRHVDSLAATLSPAARAALDTLRAWDFRAGRGQVAPTLFRSWVARLTDAADLRAEPYALAAALDGRAPALLTRRRPELAPARVVAQALEDACAALTRLLGPDVAAWTWGRAHRARFGHALEWKDRSLSPPLLAADGDRGTACVGTSGLPDGTTFTFGPAFRHVVDLATQDSSWVVVPPGNVGDAASPHARDHLPLWQNHGYAPLYLSWERAEAARESEWRLEPARP